MEVKTFLPQKFRKENGKEKETFCKQTEKTSSFN